MSEIRGQYLRLTFLWARALPELLAGEKAPSGSELPFLWKREDYARRFEEAMAAGAAGSDLQVPWLRPAGNFFWTHYLEDRTPGAISGDEAWRYLVPFRRRVSAAVRAPWAQKGQLVAESFLYPHGIAVALTARLLGSSTLEETVTAAQGLRRDRKLDLQWTEGEAESLNLDGVGRKLLQAVRREVLGPGREEGELYVAPFTVATVVQAEGVDPTAALPEGGEVHRALQGLTGWSPTWRTDSLDALGEARLATRNNPESQALYAGTRGRAVWFPGHYLPSLRKRRSLVCYHRNLVYLSMQVESLASLAQVTARVLEQGSELGSKHWECARRAAGLLGRLYSGTKTYRSHSPRLQLEQNGCVAPIDKVRRYYDMSPLG